MFVVSSRSAVELFRIDLKILNFGTFSQRDARFVLAWTSRVAAIQELRVEESIQRAFFQENRELSTLFLGNRFFSEWLETALKCSF